MGTGLRDQHKMLPLWPWVTQSFVSPKHFMSSTSIHDTSKPACSPASWGDPSPSLLPRLDGGPVLGPQMSQAPSAPKASYRM